GTLPIDITFGCIADFSPAAVARQVEPLRNLLDARLRTGAAVSESVAEIDRRMSEQLSLILHADEFQRLEGTWRGLHHLVSRTETDGLLKISVLNISKDELARTLRRYKGVFWDQSPIFRIIVRNEYGRSGGTPFGCLVGDYYFDHSER